MNNRLLAAMLVASVATSTIAQAQQHRNRGATLGGIAGAIAGAAIGKQNDETAAGALIGGALGMMTGASVGSARDVELARARAYRQQVQLQMSRAVSTQDVVTMAHSGLSDPLIVNHIHQNGVQRRLEVPDVIALHRQGVSEAVITALQRAPLARTYTAPAPVQSRPIVVQEHHYVAPPYFYRPPRYPHHPPHHHYHPRSNVSWGVRFGF